MLQPQHSMWYQHPIYNRYWAHYNQCQQWLVQLKQHQRNSLQPTKDSACACACHDEVRRQSPSRTQPNASFASRRHLSSPRSESSIEETPVRRNSDADNNLEFVISKDFADMVKISAEFRKERDARRLKELDFDLVDASTIVSGLGKHEPQKTRERIQEKKELMDIMYGKYATKIMGMMSALEITFNEIEDTKHPPLWPVIPLTMDFKNWEA